MRLIIHVRGKIRIYDILRIFNNFLVISKKKKKKIPPNSEGWLCNEVLYKKGKNVTQTNMQKGKRTHPNGLRVTCKIVNSQTYNLIVFAHIWVAMEAVRATAPLFLMSMTFTCLYQYLSSEYFYFCLLLLFYF